MSEDTDRWMTYPELAAARGISRASAARLVRRRKWRRQTDNQGAVRILVPAEDNERVDALSDVVRTFREQVQQANGRADRAESRADQAWAMVEKWMADAQALRAADAARRARGRMARLAAAWRGE
jgi:hypothetical protein